MNTKNKMITTLLILALVLPSLAFTNVNPVNAQSDTPPTPEGGVLSDYRLAAFAEVVGLTVDELQSRLDNGETFKEIASNLGITQDDYKAIFSTAIANAVADGVITEEQAEMMGSREHGRKGTAGSRAQMLETLGLTQEEMQALLDSGMTIPEVFEQQGVEFSGKPGEGQHGNANLAERCGVSEEEIQSHLANGGSIEELCPNLERPERAPGNRPARDGSQNPESLLTQ